MLRGELALKGFLHLIAAFTKVYLPPTTGLKESDVSPKATPCLEKDVVLAKDWFIASHLGSSRLMRSSLTSWDCPWW